MTHSNSSVSSALSAKLRMAIGSLVLVFFALALISGSDSAKAATPRSLIHHTVVKQHLKSPPAGRDFWFAMQSNYWGQDLGGKYMRLYITSAKTTTAFVVSQGKVTPVPVTAYKVGTFNVPEFWEMESSGIPEPKAIHVYSNDADLTVYDMSRNSATSDGSYIIPTIGWGDDYVVAAYGSLFEGFGSYVYDLPSTLCVVADQNNTTVSLTPSCDCRQCLNGTLTGTASATTVVFPANHQFTVTLNRGDAMQLMPVKASDPDNFDLTGTIIHSNVPVGVEGGSVCPNIPADYPYCDHVEDMMPSVRTWAETYYATSFAQPPNMPGHDFARYLFISSEPGQVINRSDCTTGQHHECTIDNQYGIYWDELELGQKFWSDAPFLLVAYLNSSTYPDNVNGSGDPAEVVINPREQFSDTVVFETPTNSGGKYPDPYYNYANIIVNNNDHGVTFDGQSINSKPRQCVDANWSIVTITDIAAGAHTLFGSDSGVGCYIYGYGYDESYAWTGSFGTGTFNSPDTVAPTVDTIGPCYQAEVHVADSGFLPDGIIKQSGLSEIRLDSVYNMAYSPDPNFLDGSGVPGATYDMFVVDKTKPAILIISVFDVAGNESTITSTYQPQVADIEPPLRNLGIYTPGNTKYAYDTLYNTGATPFNIDELHLLYGNVGFTFDSTIDMSPIPVGGTRVIKIQFIDPTTQKQVDSIIFGNSCLPLSVALIGSGGANDFVVTSQTWPNELYPGGPYPKTVKIENLSTIPITITNATWPDTHFTAVTTLPITVPASPGTFNFTIAYTPTAGSVGPLGIDHTQGSWTAKEVVNTDGSPSIRFDSLTGNAVKPSVSFTNDQVIVTGCTDQGQKIPITFTLTAGGTSTTTIKTVKQSDSVDFTGLIGTLDNGNTWNPSDSQQNLQPGQTATITVYYTVPSGTDITVTDFITAYDGNGDTISKTLTATVITHYYAGQVIPPTLTFAPVPYQNPSPMTSKTFLIQNTATEDSLIITRMNLAPGGYNNSFTFTTSSPLPDSIPPGQSLTVTVTFNDSISFDPTQTVQFAIISNSCEALSQSDTAYVTHPTPTTAGVTIPPILSCDTRTDSIKIVTYGGQDTSGIRFDAFTALVSTPQWVGANHYFSTPLTAPDTIKGNPKLLSGTPLPVTTYVPVTFTPPVVPGVGVQTYTDQLQIEFVNSDGHDTTELVTVTGTAGSVQVSASSVIANVTPNSPQANSQKGQASENMSLPAMVSVNIPPGLTGLGASDLNITGIQLTYIIPNRDVLTVTGSGFTIDPSSQLYQLGWRPNATPVRGPNQNGTGAGTGMGDTLIYMLSGSKPLDANTLTNNPSNFGSLAFQVDLSSASNILDSTITPVTLAAVQLFSNGTPVGPCIDTALNSSNFSLVMACGDTSIRYVIGGGQNLNFISPATPDPVTGGNVTFKYSNRGATTLSLAIYDELGNIVAQPVSNVYHDAGSWQVTCDVSKLPSGTYTYRLSGNDVKSGPMALSNQFVIQR